MKKLFIVCLIVFVLFSQLASFPYNQVKAETLTGNSLFDTVEMKDTTNHIIDEALNPKNLIQAGSTIHLEYAWSIKDHQTDSTVLQIHKALKVKSDKQGNLMADQQIIGQYFVTANDKGQITVDNLKPGTYYLQETTAPGHYKLDSTPIQFTIKEDQTTVVYRTATNSLIPGSAILTKVDKDGKTLAGAEFSVRDRNNKIIPGYRKLTTNDQGQIEAKDLRPGDYQFVEEKAPEHYDIDKKPIEFTIVKSQKKAVTVTATNHLIKGGVTLTKIDDIDGTTLAGAVFKIVNKDGHDVRTDLTTDKNGRLVVDELAPGDYEFIETKAPTHYDLNETPIKFTVKKGQEKIASVTATNSLTKGAVELSKVDDVDGTALKDAVFKIVDMNGNDVHSDLTTDKDGKISVSDLRPGDYQFIETKAPTGYDLNAKSIPFTITKGQSQVTSVTALNSLTTGSMELTKVDMDHHGKLEGAIFNILGQDGKVVREGLKTDGHGKLIVNDLKSGNYQLVETKAPEGYQLDASPINFTIEKAQAAPLQITVSNKKIDSSSGGDDKPITPPNKEEETGKETFEEPEKGTPDTHGKGTSEELEKENPDTHGKGPSEELEKENPDTQINKQQDDQNKGKELPNTGHKNDPTQTVGIVLLLAGLLSILATKRKKYY
ncbi:MSCRAMM family protein [Bacillus wiedmannii]|uniref:MSCRAMM family protein n=1 Tax=Bacillus wiedmannii TaxID=1890302 RepID=UPI003857F3E9